MVTEAEDQKGVVMPSGGEENILHPHLVGIATEKGYGLTERLSIACTGLRI